MELTIRGRQDQVKRRGLVGETLAARGQVSVSAGLEHVGCQRSCRDRAGSWLEVIPEVLSWMT
jgi:hypothetical protein